MVQCKNKSVLKARKLYSERSQESMNKKRTIKIEKERKEKNLVNWRVHSIQAHRAL